MKMHIRMPRQPSVLLGFVRVQIVQDNVNILLAVDFHDLIHEIQKLPPSPPLELTGFDQTGRDPRARQKAWSCRAGYIRGKNRSKPARWEVESILAPVLKPECTVFHQCREPLRFGAD